MKALVLATNNAHKISEYKEILPGIPLRSLAEFPPMAEVDETADDFEGNAVLKARAVFAHTGLPALADDSGICVAALGGAPGVRSARYVAGSDRDRLFALLAAMEGQADRRAWFVCAIAVAGLPEGLPLPAGVVRQDGLVLTRGEVHGVLAQAPRGPGGFGYDPIFELPEGQTTAELPAALKHAVSHRGRAARTLLPVLQAWLAETKISVDPAAHPR